MSGIIRPLPQYVFMAWCSVKAQGPEVSQVKTEPLHSRCDIVASYIVNTVFEIRKGPAVDECFHFCINITVA
jgi:hypothetical protein